MKYKIGDKVRIKKDLVVEKAYGDNTYIGKMDTIAKNFDYILTIKGYNFNRTQYVMLEDGEMWNWTEEMIEGLYIEPTDREKFEECMRKLSSLKSEDRVWNAFNHCVTTEPDEDGYEDELKIISDYLFGKKMSKTEIEKELGYKIEIVEGE
jgi:hypothetical protein